MDDAGGFNKKPIGLVTNSPKLAEELTRKCPGNHFHTPTMEGRPKLAQRYPNAFCKAVLRDLRRQVEEDHGQRASTFLGGEDSDEEHDEAQHGMVGPEPLVEEQDSGRTPTAEEQAAIKKLHNNTGHPQLGDFVRFLKAARMKPEVVRWVAKEFSCDLCLSRAKPKVSRPAAIPGATSRGRWSEWTSRCRRRKHLPGAFHPGLGHQLSDGRAGRFQGAGGGLADAYEDLVQDLRPSGGAGGRPGERVPWGVHEERGQP